MLFVFWIRVTKSRRGSALHEPLTGAFGIFSLAILKGTNLGYVVLQAAD